MCAQSDNSIRNLNTVHCDVLHMIIHPSNRAKVTHDFTSVCVNQRDIYLRVPMFFASVRATVFRRYLSVDSGGYVYEYSS